jgi:elongation factor Ts
VEFYLHHDGKGAAMIELNCETDFVARTDDFRELAREIAQHVYATAPRWLSKEDIPGEVLDKERAVYRTRGESEGKQGKALEGFVEGQLRGYQEEMCLLEQVFVRDLARPKKERRTISDLIKETASKLGENLLVGRMARFRVGEASE